MLLIVFFPGASGMSFWKDDVVHVFWFNDLMVHNCRPRAILDIIKSGEDFRISTSTKMPEQGTCERCGYISSQVKYILLQSKTSQILVSLGFSISIVDLVVCQPLWDLVQFT